MALAAQLLRDGKMTSDEFVKEIMSGILHLASQGQAPVQARAQVETKDTLMARVEAGTLSCEDAINEMISMYEYLDAQGYEGTKDLMVHIRCVLL